MAKPGEEARREVATACRILGAAIGSTGHVSSRIDDREMYLRCRGSNEAGLAYADTPSVRRMDFDGKGPLIGAYRTPHETPLHGEVYKLRPDANAVVHVHPYHAVLCGLRTPASTEPAEALRLDQCSQTSRHSHSFGWPKQLPERQTGVLPSFRRRLYPITGCYFNLSSALLRKVWFCELSTPVLARD